MLLVTENFPPMPGGVARFLHNLCVYSQTDVSVLATEVEDDRSEGFDRCQPYPIFRIRLSAHLGFLKLLVWAYRHVVAFRPDVVFWGHTPWIAVAGRWLKAWFGKRLVLLVHGTELNMSLNGSRLSRRLVLSALRGADLVLVNSHDTGQHVGRLGVPDERIRVLNPGVDVREFHPGVDASDLAQRYGVVDKKVLLTVSRLVPKKNHAAVLRALPRVLSYVPNAVYMIVGDGPERVNLKQLSDNLGLREHVIFIPYTTGLDLIKLYNLCDVFVMVSKTTQMENLPGGPMDVESFGIAFVEAGACGKPVIGGRSGGMLDAVVEGETGLLVDPDDEKAIAEAIIRLLTDETLARRMGGNGRRRGVEELSWEKVAARFDNALLTCLSERRGLSGR